MAYNTSLIGPELEAVGFGWSIGLSGPPVLEGEGFSSGVTSPGEEGVSSPRTLELLALALELLALELLALEFLAQEFLSRGILALWLSLRVDYSGECFLLVRCP